MVTKPSPLVLDDARGMEWPLQVADEKPSLLGPGRHESRPLSGTASATVKFLLHFVEMAIAMGVGMAIFGPVRSALLSQGYTALLDTHSIDYQVGMNLFMVVPMVLWMRARGHSWRHGFEMGAAMVVPVALILFVCGLASSKLSPGSR
jgi:hypothetical protein